MRTRLLLVLVVLAAIAAPGAAASPSIRYGVQDDAWLEYGPGTLNDRVAQLQSLGVGVVRVTVHWDQVEPVQGTDDWSRTDTLLPALHNAGIAPLVTLTGAPGWANGERASNWAPTSGATFAAFARRVAQRYPFVHLWTIWNEPNQRIWLRPTSPTLYTTRLLNPAYAAIHAASPGSLVAGGVTAPRGSTDGVSPVAWIRGMAAAHARLDAYAHNPYPLDPHRETPFAGGCSHCDTITMATLGRLLADVKQAFGASTRIWLTEYGYQTSPPDPLLGVPMATQARYIAEAALRAYEEPRVDILINYLVRDEPGLARWQSGLETVSGTAKPSYHAFQVPLAQRARTGLRTTIWGQVRRNASSRYVLQQQQGSLWVAVGGTATTTARGYLQRVVRAGTGARFRLWLPDEQSFSDVLTIS